MDEDLVGLFARHDALIAECRRSDRQRALITKQDNGCDLYRTQEARQPAEQASADDRWNAWACEHIERAFEAWLGPAIKDALAEMRDMLRAEIARELGAVRADQIVDRSELKRLKGSVAKSANRKRDADA